MNINKTKVISLKSNTAGVIPTVPTVSNHKTPGWLSPTDIYEGEFFFNTADQALYLRAGNSIIQIGGATVSRYLDDLLDVDAATPSSADILTFDGTNWISKQTFDGVLNVDETLRSVYQETCGLGALAANSFAEGLNTFVSGSYGHAEGSGTSASHYSHAEGQNTTASGNISHSEGNQTIASGNYSHSENYRTTASGLSSHSENYRTTASGDYSHAEGYRTDASGECSHAEGNLTQAIGNNSHAEGFSNAIGNNSHAEGGNITDINPVMAIGESSHAEGSSTIASGNSSHAEGRGSITTSDGYYGHAEGNGATAYLQGMHAKKSSSEGLGQYCNVTVYAQTTDDVKTNLLISSDPGRIIIPTNTIYNFRVLGIGADASGNTATYKIEGTAKNIAGTVTVVNVTATEITDDFTITGMSAEADDTNNALIITTTGEAATTINWSAFVEWQEITFA